MGKVRDASKERYWRKLMGRQRRGGQTVAQFCAGEDVSVHQFYWWQRTLRERDRRRPSNGKVGTGKAGQVGARVEKDKEPSFLPVRLALSSPAAIELVHPGGWVVRVPVGFDPKSLRQILLMLEPATAEASED